MSTLPERARLCKADVISSFVHLFGRHAQLAEYRLISSIQEFLPEMAPELREKIQDKLFDMRLFDTFKLEFFEQFEDEVVTIGQINGYEEQLLSNDAITHEISLEIEHLYTRWKRFSSFVSQDFYKRLMELEVYTCETSLRHKLLKRVQLLRIMLGKITRLYHFLSQRPSISRWLDEAEQLFSESNFPKEFIATFTAELEAYYRDFEQESDYVERMVWW